MLAVALASVPVFPPRAEESVCVGQGVGTPNAAGFVEEALLVLRGAGYEPENYRLDLLGNDPLAGPGNGKSPGTVAVFRPIDGTGLHAVTVSRADPCVVGWVPGASGLTGWQRRALERARSHVRSMGPGEMELQTLRLRVTETREHVGFRLSSDAPGSGSEEWRVLLRKRDLAIVGSEGPGKSPE